MLTIEQTHQNCLLINSIKDKGLTPPNKVTDNVPSFFNGSVEKYLSFNFVDLDCAPKKKVFPSLVYELVLECGQLH